MFEIKNRFTLEVIFSADVASMKLCVELALKSRANLSCADLSCADLYGAYLYGADLSCADLSRADLSRAYLSGANLSRAYLSGANLSCADLSCADLSRADLYRANLSCADLSRAEYGEGIPLENEPLMLIGSKYHVIVMDAHIKIGCQLHSHRDWENFSDEAISEMDSGALEWWKEWKGFVLSLSLSHQQRIAKK